MKCIAINGGKISNTSDFIRKNQIYRYNKIDFNGNRRYEIYTGIFSLLSGGKNYEHKTYLTNEEFEL